MSVIKNLQNNAHIDVIHLLWACSKEYCLVGAVFSVSAVG